MAGLFVRPGSHFLIQWRQIATWVLTLLWDLLSDDMNTHWNVCEMSASWVFQLIRSPPSPLTLVSSLTSLQSQEWASWPWSCAGRISYLFWMFKRPPLGRHLSPGRRSRESGTSLLTDLLKSSLYLAWGPGLSGRNDMSADYHICRDV